jgi:hypothetical protein
MLELMGAKGGRAEGPRYGLGFRAGNQIKFYSQSLYWLIRHVGLVEVTTEFLADGEPVIYGVLSCDELDGLVAAGRLRHLRRHFWGVSWPYDDQGQEADDGSGYEHWRDRLLTFALDNLNESGACCPELPRFH